VARQAEALVRNVAEKNSNTGRDAVAEFGEIHVELERLPEPLARFLLIFRAHEQIERIAVLAQQSFHQVAPEVSGLSGEKNCHGVSGSPRYALLRQPRAAAYSSPDRGAAEIRADGPPSADSTSGAERAHGC